MTGFLTSPNGRKNGSILTGICFVVLGYVWAQSAVETSSTLFNFYRVLVLPFLLAGCVSLWHARKTKSSKSDQNTIPWTVILSFGIASYVVIFSTLKMLRLYSANYDVFDAGVYYNKLWRLNDMPIGKGIWTALSEGHFQPVNIIWVLLPKTNFIFEIAMLFETVALSFGAVAVFKLAKFLLKSKKAAGLLSIAYLLNPQLHFNDILGYHPDFLVLPSLLWGFYFLERGKRKTAILAFSLLLLAGEPWIPLCGFIGFSLVLMRRYWREGLILNLISVCVFLFVFVLLLSIANSQNSAGNVFATNGNFQIVYEPTIENFIELFSDPRKWMYFIIILLPFLFSAFLTPIAAFMLIPEFSKSIFSNEPLHYAAEGHYTLAYIGVSFWALIKFIHQMEKSSLKLQNWLPRIVLAMTLGLSVGHGVLPHAYNFWAEISGGAFHMTKYTSFERASELHLALEKFDLQKWHSVETDNNVFSPVIGRRQDLSLFPSNSFQSVDFIITSKKGNQTSGSESGQQGYINEVRVAQNWLEKCFDVSSTKSFFIFRNHYQCDANKKPTKISN